MACVLYVYSYAEVFDEKVRSIHCGLRANENFKLFLISLWQQGSDNNWESIVGKW